MKSATVAPERKVSSVAETSSASGGRRASQSQGLGGPAQRIYRTLSEESFRWREEMLAINDGEAPAELAAVDGFSAAVASRDGSRFVVGPSVLSDSFSLAEFLWPVLYLSAVEMWGATVHDLISFGPTDSAPNMQHSNQQKQMQQQQRQQQQRPHPWCHQGAILLLAMLCVGGDRLQLRSGLFASLDAATGIFSDDGAVAAAIATASLPLPSARRTSLSSKLITPSLEVLATPTAGMSKNRGTVRGRRRTRPLAADAAGALKDDHSKDLAESSSDDDKDIISLRSGSSSSLRCIRGPAHAGMVARMSEVLRGLMASGLVPNPEAVKFDVVVETYADLFFLPVTCGHIADFCATLANFGSSPRVGRTVWPPLVVEKTLNCMIRLGMPQPSFHSFLYWIGLPAMANSLGCVAAVLPGHVGICSRAPLLDEFGVCVRGQLLLQSVVNRFPHVRMFGECHVPPLVFDLGRDPSIYGLLMLEAAAVGNDRLVAEVLHAELVDVNFTNADGRSALHLAVVGDHEDVVRTLLRFGAVATTEDRWGTTALVEARSRSKKSALARSIFGVLEASQSMRNRFAGPDVPAGSAVANSDPAQSFGGRLANTIRSADSGGLLSGLPALPSSHFSRDARQLRCRIIATGPARSGKTQLISALCKMAQDASASSSNAAPAAAAASNSPSLSAAVSVAPSTAIKSGRRAAAALSNFAIQIGTTQTPGSAPGTASPVTSVVPRFFLTMDENGVQKKVQATVWDGIIGEPNSAELLGLVMDNETASTVLLYVYNAASVTTPVHLSQLARNVADLRSCCPHCPLVIVGTHADELSKEGALQALNLAKTHLRSANISTSHVCLYSNQTGAKAVRHVADILVDAIRHVHELEVPLSRSIYDMEHKLLYLQSEYGKSVLSYYDFKKVAASCGLQTNAEVRHGLTQLCQHGSILLFHFQDCQSDLVILDPLLFRRLLGTIREMLAAEISLDAESVRTRLVPVVKLENFLLGAGLEADVVTPMRIILDALGVALSSPRIENMLFVPNAAIGVRRPPASLKLFATKMPPLDESTTFRLRFDAPSMLGFDRSVLCFSQLPEIVSSLYWRFGLAVNYANLNLRVQLFDEGRVIKLRLNYARNSGGYAAFALVCEVMDQYLLPLADSVVVLCRNCDDDISSANSSCSVSLRNCLLQLAESKASVRMSCGSELDLFTALPHRSLPWMRRRCVPAAEIKLLAEIARGIGSIVYLGEHAGTEVAVKVFTAAPTQVELPLDADVSSDAAGSRDPSVVMAFAREVLIQSYLSHPNCLKLLHYSIEQLSITMEYLPFGSLFGYLHSSSDMNAACRELSWPRRVRIGLDVALACAYMHSLLPPMMHRDLKSPNVLLVQDPALGDPGDARPFAKVIDFGSTLWIDDWATDRLVDNPVWLAPEIIAHQKYSLASDVYSFGVILFEIFSCQEFFGECAFLSAIEDKVLDGCRPLLVKEYGVPRSCVDLVHRCWASSPDTRPDFLTVVSTLTGILTDVLEVTLSTELSERIEACLQCDIHISLSGSSASGSLGTKKSVQKMSRRSSNRRVRHADAVGGSFSGSGSTGSLEPGVVREENLAESPSTPRSKERTPLPNSRGGGHRSSKSSENDTSSCESFNGDTNKASGDDFMSSSKVSLKKKKSDKKDKNVETETKDKSKDRGKEYAMEKEKKEKGKEKEKEKEKEEKEKEKGKEKEKEKEKGKGKGKEKDKKKVKSDSKRKVSSIFDDDDDDDDDNDAVQFPVKSQPSASASPIRSRIEIAPSGSVEFSGESSLKRTQSTGVQRPNTTSFNSLTGSNVNLSNMNRMNSGAAMDSGSALMQSRTRSMTSSNKGSGADGVAVGGVDSSLLRNVAQQRLQSVVSSAAVAQGSIWIGCSDGSIALIDSNTAKLMTTPHSGHKESVNAVVVVEGDKLVLTVDRLMLCAWDLLSPAKKVMELKKGAGGSCMEAGADGSSVWIGDVSGLIEVRWKARKQLKVARTVPLGDVVTAMQLAGDTLWALCSTFIALVNVDTGAVTQRLQMPNRSSSFFADLDGGVLWLGGADGGVRVYDLKRRAIIEQFNAHGGPVARVVALRGHRVITASVDGSLAVWDSRVRARLGSSNLVHGGGIFVVLAVDEPDKIKPVPKIVTSGGDGYVRIAEVI